jgi:hypothetical protein
MPRDPLGLEYVGRQRSTAHDECPQPRNCDVRPAFNERPLFALDRPKLLVRFRPFKSEAVGQQSAHCRQSTTSRGLRKPDVRLRAPVATSDG